MPIKPRSHLASSTFRPAHMQQLHHTFLANVLALSLTALVVFALSTYLYQDWVAIAYSTMPFCLLSVVALITQTMMGLFIFRHAGYQRRHQAVFGIFVGYLLQCLLLLLGILVLMQFQWSKTTGFITVLGVSMHQILYNAIAVLLQSRA